MLLQVDSLVKVYGDHRALDGVSFSVPAGERVALLGSNGSGKTTTVRSICRLLEWDGGEILFDGQPIRRRRNYLAEIGAVLEGSRDLNWRLSARQNALYYSGIRGVSDRRARPVIEAMMARLGLSEYGERTVGRLSTGNRQKSALLCALVHQPRLLLLDEPTLGLDLQTMDELENVLVQLKDQAMLITSHDLRFIDKVCTRVILIDKGRVLFDGGTADLRRRLFHYELNLDLGEGMAPVIAEAMPDWLAGVRARVSLEGGRLLLQYDEPAAAMGVLARLHAEGVPVGDMVIAPLSLEKAYKTLIATEAATA